MSSSAPSNEPKRGPFDDTIPASEPPEDIPASQPPTKPDRYKLGPELGRGGMGRVVEAYDTQLGRTVALKEVLPGGGPGTSRRFAREVKLTARLEHPSIVPLYDSGVTIDGRPYYVMRRVTGRPFDELVARARGLDDRLTLLPSLSAAIDAIAHAHRRGVIHRDLKPANILVGEHGETVVIDWGLAKVVGEEDDAGRDSRNSFRDSLPPESFPPDPGDSLKTQVGSVFGTPGFMPPEQARGEELGTHGDVYALGATLYQLLAGTPPVSGVSATEVIDKTVRHDVRPLADVVQGAPPELVAIVDKALAFEADKRYPDAGALGEDVRRFLTGQLVAAHRYTSVQRVSRFARRHRAPLGVAALAMVTLAVLAWVGVHRIITERDAATEARADAVAGQRAAEAARDQLAERHDALVVTQARALLDANPTEAAATLKQIGPKSPRLAEARALAQAAAVRGIVWAMQSTHELTIIAELDPTARRLVQVSRDGMVRVWDVDRRRLVLARPYASGTRALWVAGGKLLVIHDKVAAQLLEPNANTSEPLALPPIEYAFATERGDRAIARMTDKTVQLIDIATRTATPVLPGQTLEDFAIAPDGSWLAAVTKQALIVLDPAGRELVRRPGKVDRVVGSAHRTLAVLQDGKLFECALEPQPMWTEIPLGPQPPGGIFDVIYRDRELDAYTATGKLQAWNGKRVFQRLAVDGISFPIRVAGGGAVIVQTPDGKLHYATALSTGTIALPSAAPRGRVATRAGSSRVIVVGDGVIMGLDLAAMTPRELPVERGTQAVWIDDDTLMLQRNIDEWTWLDVASGRTTKVDYLPHGLPMITGAEAATGRLLVREVGGPDGRVMLMRKHAATARVVAEGREPWARLIPGDAIVFGVGDDRLFGQLGTEPPHLIGKLDGVVESAVPLGLRRFAARSSTGELVRGDVAGGTLERTRVPVGSDGFVAADATGRVIVVEDSRLMVWDGAVTEIAHFDKAIQRVDPVAGGVAVHFGDGEVQALALAPNAKPHRVLPPARRFATLAGDGTLLAGLGSHGEVTLAELPSRARWSLPALYTSTDVLSLSPASRRLIQGTERPALALWTLPVASPDDLGAWLDEQTNAKVDADGVLAWPWQ